MEEFEGRRRGMVQPSQQYVAPCVKGVKWGLVEADSKTSAMQMSEISRILSLGFIGKCDQGKMYKYCTHKYCLICIYRQN